VSNVETGETKQVTDGLADAVWPAWDASGKYLWFLASTDFGLRSQWLDMTSYDHDETFGLYLAVLKKSEPSPLLPESDEDKGIGARRAPAARPAAVGRRGHSAADAAQTDTPRNAVRRARPPVNVQIDFDGLQQRIIAVPGIPERQYTQAARGAAGHGLLLEAARGRGGRGGGFGGEPGSTLHRYR
jgi:tricorn protease